MIHNALVTTDLVNIYMNNLALFVSFFTLVPFDINWTQLSNLIFLLNKKC